MFLHYLPGNFGTNLCRICVNQMWRLSEEKICSLTGPPPVNYQAEDKLFFVVYLNSSRIIPRYFLKLGNDVVSLHKLLNLFFTNNSTIKTF